ncbi:MAG: nucleotide exchange factor GrpE [Chloroflexota bacterium]
MTDDNPPAGDGAPTARDGRAEVRELERQLEEARTQVRDAEARAAENLDRWQRAQADLANFKRRVQFDRDLDQKYASAQVLADFLRVLDGFDRAWKSLPSSLRMLSWIEGLMMLDRQAQAIVERYGVRPIEAHGKPFDPRFHEAVASDTGDGNDHVVEIFQMGYELHERVLRPALVRVGPKPAPPPEDDASAPQHDHVDG